MSRHGSFSVLDNLSTYPRSLSHKHLAGSGVLIIDMSSSTNYARSTRNSDPDAEICNIESQQSIAITPVPIIDLPHRWDENGALIAESSPAQCHGCRWNGDPKYLLRKKSGHEHCDPPYILDRDCQAGPFDCVRCECMRRLLLQVARDIGLAGLGIIKLEFLDGNKVVIYDEEAEGVHGTYLIREIFISYDSQSSVIDQYDITRRRMISTGTQWASDLISKCTSFHEECNLQIAREFLPSRLISIEPNEECDNPRLSLQSSRAVPPGSQYVALSYCWGDYKPACMTTQFDDKDSIPLEWSDLPRTFQDAARFTLGLGVNFLWIDSICIIQGDSKDWNQEAPKMNAVYKNSYVTLAGLCGYDSRNGLRTSSMKETSSPFVQLRTAQATHVVYSRMCHYLDWRVMDQASENSRFCCPYPLLTRAWTYQERIVSSRVVFFTESEMIYQCQCQVTCECGSSRDNHGVDTDMTSDLNKSQIWSAIRSRPDLSPESPRSSISQALCRERIESAARIWRKTLVTEYSRLAVSESRDRLPAIGALAEQFQDARPDEEYLAGLWSGTLLEDLLWFCSRGLSDKQGLTNKENLARHDGLPTWTWASVRGAVSHRSPSIAGVHKTHFKAHCKYTNNKKFGTLESSHLEVEGRVLVCMLKWIEDKDGLKTKLSLQNGDILEEIQNIDYSYPTRWIHLYMDCDQDGFQSMPRQQIVHLLEMESPSGSNEKRGGKSWLFLLLRLEAETQGRTRGIQAFTRGGLVTVAESSTALYSNNHWSREDSSSGNSQPDCFETIMEQHSQLTKCEIR